MAATIDVNRTIMRLGAEVDRLKKAIRAVPEYSEDAEMNQICVFCGNLSPRDFDESTEEYRRKNPGRRGHVKGCVRGELA